MAQGKNNAAIATALTVSNGRSRSTNAIFMKLGLSEERDVNRRVKAVLLFLGRGERTDRAGAGRAGDRAPPRRARGQRRALTRSGPRPHRSNVWPSAATRTSGFAPARRRPSWSSSASVRSGW